MKKLLQLAGTVALFTFAYTCVYLTIEIPREIDATRSEALGQLDITRKALISEVQKTRSASVKEIQQTRKELLATTDARLDSVTALLAQSEKDLNNQLTATNETLARFGDNTSSQIGALNVNANEIVDDLHDEWIGPKSMGFSRMLAVSGEVMKTGDETRKTMKAVSDATPEFLDDGKRITNAAADYVAPKTPPKKQPFYIRWLPTIAVTAGKILF